MAAGSSLESIWDGATPAWPTRFALDAASLLFAAGRALHRGLYQLGLRRRIRLPAVVVSIGNLAVGGVGKTPVAAWLAHELLARGLRVMVLARGYRRAPGAALNDEGAWLAAREPQLRVVQAADRASAARAALAQERCDVILLDDGFQHERLARDLEVVLLEAAAPFRNGRRLPRGPLRDPPAALARADWVVATRCERLALDALARCKAELLRHAPHARFAALRFVIASLRRGARREAATALAGQPVVLCTGVGAPAQVRATALLLGARVVAELRHPDHHAFTAADLAAAHALAERHGATLLVTAKDAVKLDALAPDAAERYAVLEQEVAPVEGGGELLEEIVALVARAGGRATARVSSSSR